ncbi:hypothetical protein Tco_0776595 [Tanacetum coccineum]
MAAISNVPHLVDKKGGNYSAVAPPLDLKKFSKWKKRMLCYLTGMEPNYIQCLKDGHFKEKTTEGADKPESQWTPDERRVVNQDQRLKSIIISCLPNDIMELVISCETAKSTWTDLVYSFEEEVSDDEEMTQVKVLMALANDKLSVGKNHARNGEWIDITIKKCRHDLFALKQAKLEAVTFQIQNTKLTKLNRALQKQLKEERKVKHESMANQQENQEQHQDRPDEKLVPVDDQVRIRASNYKITLDKSQPNVIYKVFLAILKKYSFFNAFIRTNDAPEIYMQQFLDTVTSLQITPKDSDHPFVEPPSKKEIISFINKLGYSESLTRISDMTTNNLKASKDGFILQKRPKGSSEGSGVSLEVLGGLSHKGLNKGYGMTLAVPDEPRDSSSSSSSEFEIDDISNDDESDEADDKEKADDSKDSWCSDETSSLEVKASLYIMPGNSFSKSDETSGSDVRASL